MLNNKEDDTLFAEGCLMSPLPDLSCEGIDVWPCLDTFKLNQPTELDLKVAKIFLSQKFEQAILPFLELVGQTHEGDRAWCVEYTDDLSSFRDTYEWCESGVTTHNVDNLNIPSTALGAMHDFMKKGHPVTIYDVTEMPRTMRALQTKLELQNTLSSIGIPILVEGKLRGIMGIDMTRTHKRWSPQTIQQLCRLAELFGLSRFSNHDSQNHESNSAPVNDANYIYFQGSRAIVGANLHDVITCCAEKDNTRIFLKNGSDILDSRSLKWWEKVLPESHFMRIHRSTIIKLSNVGEIKRRPTGQWTVYIKGYEAPLNVSRNKATLLRNRLGC